MYQPETLDLKRSEFAQATLHLAGQPFSLADYPHLVDIYDCASPEIVLQFSRQTAKSTTLAAISVSNCAMMPDFKNLFIAPTVDQAKVYSHDRVHPFLQSPLIRKTYVDSSVVQNVFMKELTNRSKMYIRYALLDADRIRGYCNTYLHQYLTLRGWVKVEHLTKDDWVLTKNEKTNEFEYQQPTEIIDEPYEGPIHVYKLRNKVMMEVTPDHRMHADILKQKHEGAPFGTGWQTEIRSKDIHTQNFRMGIGNPKDCWYKDSSPEYFELPELKTSIKANGQPYQDGKLRTYTAIKLPIRSFMKFMGWWLSEGWTVLDSPSLGVCQDKNHNLEHWTEIDDIMKELFPNHTRQLGNITEWVCNSDYRTLYEWLKPLGKSGDKYIPRELLEYTKYLPDLLDALYKGDGDNLKTGKQKPTHKDYLRLNTKSNTLADSVQEAWLRLGKWASVKHRDRKYGRIYTIEVRSRTYGNWLLNKYKKTKHKYFEEKYYKGRIYCVVVPNGNFVTRHIDSKVPFITGNSADQNNFDECQDLAADIIPVVKETMSRSLYKWTTYSGTPKRTRGTLADIWHDSTMNEYVIKCRACNHWNVLGEDNIGTTGVICSKCGGGINVKDKAEWVSTYSLTQKPSYEGFRVCALHFDGAPWVNWEKDILGKRKIYSKAKFLNEVLALEHDAGVTPITEADMRRAAVGVPYHSEPNATDKGYTSIMGIDYGPVNSEKSNTVISIVQQRGTGLEVVYAKKFIGKEADYAYIHNEIPILMKKWNCMQLAADYGMGDAPNSEIRSRIGYQKVVAFQNLQTQKEEIHWNPKMPAYTVNKTKALNRLFQNIKRGLVVFPAYNSFLDFIEDIYNVQIEADEKLGNIKYVNIGADDFVYATLYATIAATLYWKINWQD